MTSKLPYHRNEPDSRQERGGIGSRTVDIDPAWANTVEISATKLGGKSESRSVGRLNVLKQLIDRIKGLLGAIRERIADRELFYQVRYSSAPLWKPWRDY